MKGTETYEVKRNIQIITFLQAEGRVRILFSMYAHYFLYKKKDDSEGRTRSLEFGIKNHGDLLPGLQAESKNCQSVPSWISELLWSSDSSIASHLPLCEQEYLQWLWCACSTIVSKDSLSSNPGSKLGILGTSNHTLATWCKELTHLKRPWCWERLKAGEGDDRGWDGWLASLTQ